MMSRLRAARGKSSGSSATADDSMMLRQVIEATPNAMVMVDSRGRITLVNQQMEILFGHSRADLLEMTVERLIPDRFRERHVGFRDGFFQRPDTRSMGAGRDLFGRHASGREFPIEIGLNPILINEEHHVLASIIDISERLQIQATESARTADRLRASILASLPFSIIASEPDGTIVTANPAAERLLGFDRDELIGSPISAVRTDTTDLPLVDARTDGGGEREVDYHRKDGRTIPVNESIAPIDGEDGIAGVLSVAYDITQRREAEAFIRHMADYDFLTDLPNRSKLFERLDEDLRTAARTGVGVTVGLIDLDHFKRVNDSLGHHVGDELLVEMAARLSAVMHPSDLVARVGGDEFVLVFTGSQDPARLGKRIDEVLSVVLEPVICFGHELVVTASMGVARSPEAGQDPATLLKHADTAMYHAKSSARNSYRWFEGSMLDETNDKLEMASALRHALTRRELSVVYQPQVCLLEGHVIGVEALARWRTADGHSISPDRFIPAAEDNGLIIQLGEWVLRRACEDVVEMSAKAGVPLRLAVNVSPRQFQDRGWLDVVRRALADSGLPPEQLELEITEGIFMEDPREVVDVMDTVRSLGVGIVVDDFGTGFSSLAYLSRFTIDKLKIDRSFVADLAAGGTDAAIVDTIILMAHALGMTVVAEGVETLAQQEYLQARSCDVGQGFRYSAALPPEELIEHIGGSEASWRASDDL
ncbi:putative bifunctional diguanylate cyclase/phosphodiesterase [Aeromicrobium wangtongii]|uniref:EAL domain-containing protein n=1 Tax=Aeromicrobium wangtongii TaxID=2969247 RepID=A0ABY5MBL3_9ACTN|nr:EAL domain-containing protein [Aeromicrobium wangtongii]MCD9198276.1 EAL domain-containing protein [Aeromicrobium wangtongii]UUP15515.1 EAL domain-containing protein [Aeromicrobium wangtongii]